MNHAKMQNGSILRWSVAVAAVAILYYLELFWTAVSWASVVVFGAAGFFLGAAVVLNSGKRYTPRSPGNHGSLANILLTRLVVSRAPTSTKSIHLTIKMQISYLKY